MRLATVGSILKHFSMGSALSVLSNVARHGKDQYYVDSLKIALGFAREFKARVRVKKSGIWFDIPSRSREALKLHARMLPSSDLLVMRQIFHFGEYQPALRYLDHCCRMGKQICMIDAGANVGYTTARFVDALPHLRLIAIEPDAGNYRLLERNVRANTMDVTLIQGALWNADARLSIATDFRDRKEWSYYCVEKPDGSIQGLSVTTLAGRYDMPQVDFFKIDIEGGEFPLFASDEFVRFVATRVSMIGVEIHDEFGRRDDILDALTRANFNVFVDGQTVYGLSHEVSTTLLQDPDSVTQ